MSHHTRKRTEKGDWEVNWASKDTGKVWTATRTRLLIDLTGDNDEASAPRASSAITASPCTSYYNATYYATLPASTTPGPQTRQLPTIQKVMFFGKCWRKSIVNTRLDGMNWPLRPIVPSTNSLAHEHLYPRSDRLPSQAWPT
ncbi:hypothetical protein CC86DRAFT_411598 [Ophiobolus disseminans]|uniref:Uncharacterized protein n=1 Tax=Ophiobolus disseminans TaxID=1469910 RepID=A0A6A6ZKM3_9PLEO|nr:hypothetical protein CC86DRAFT_411598 [Ophiobolus disseminans]